jgi:hypothetical protein
MPQSLNKHRIPLAPSGDRSVVFRLSQDSVAAGRQEGFLCLFRVVASFSRFGQTVVPFRRVHRHACVACRGQFDLVLAHCSKGTRSQGEGPRVCRKVKSSARLLLASGHSSSKHGGLV